MRHGRISESEGGRDEPLTWGAPYQRQNLQPGFFNDNDAWRSESAAEQTRAPAANALTSNPAGDIFSANEHAGAATLPMNGAAAIKALFSALKEILLPADEEAPEPKRRRRGETDKGFVVACRLVFRRIREARVMSENAFLDVCASAGVFLSDTHDPLSIWQNNETIEQTSQEDAINGTYWDHFPEP